MKRSLLLALLSLVVVRAGQAGVLPEDRADVLVHSYDGGGVTIQGPTATGHRAARPAQAGAGTCRSAGRTSAAKVRMLRSASSKGRPA